MSEDSLGCAYWDLSTTLTVEYFKEQKNEKEKKFWNRDSISKLRRFPGWIPVKLSLAGDYLVMMGKRVGSSELKIFLYNKEREHAIANIELESLKRPQLSFFYSGIYSKSDLKLLVASRTSKIYQIEEFTLLEVRTIDYRLQNVKLDFGGGVVIPLGDVFQLPINILETYKETFIIGFGMAVVFLAVTLLACFVYARRANKFKYKERYTIDFEDYERRTVSVISDVSFVSDGASVLKSVNEKMKIIERESGKYSKKIPVLY